MPSHFNHLDPITVIHAYAATVSNNNQFNAKRAIGYLQAHPAADNTAQWDHIAEQFRCSPSPKAFIQELIHNLRGTREVQIGSLRQTCSN